MGYLSTIEWTDHTFNPWWGCTKVSPACDNCYAEQFARRFGLQVWNHRSSRRFLSEANWSLPLKWNAKAASSGVRARVFCASMGDVFEWKKELSPARRRLWLLIEETPHLAWLLLTKRPHLVGRMIPWGDDWPTNVWLGTTVENQKWLDKRLPHLEALPTENRFLSCEPLLGKIDLSQWLARGTIGWVIAGGESGSAARPTEPNWFYGLRDQCLTHDVPFHFKQWGNWAPVNSVGEHLPTTTLTIGFSTPMGRYAKKVSGRQLQGRYWDQVPEF